MQALYVDSGLENFYKGLLDLGNNVVQTFTNMPKLFKLPIPALASFGMQFASLSTVIVNAFKALRVRLNAEEKLNNIAVKLASNERITETEREFAIRESKYRDGYSKLYQELSRQEEAQTEKVAQETQERLQIQENALANSLNNEKLSFTDKLIAQGGMRGRVGGLLQSIGQTKVGGLLKSTIGSTTGLSLLGLGLNTVSSMTSNRGVKAITGIGGSALQGASFGMMMGHPIIGAAIGALTGLISNWTNIWQDSAQKIADLKKEAEESSNEEIRKRSETKSLADSIANLKKLEAARYDSIEAEQEYYEVANQLADTYPGLIASIDSVGNATIDLDAAERQLASTRAEGVEAAKQAAIDNIKLAQEQQKQAEKAAEAGTSYGEWFENLSNDDRNKLFNAQSIIPDESPLQDILNIIFGFGITTAEKGELLKIGGNLYNDFQNISVGSLNEYELSVYELITSLFGEMNANISSALQAGEATSQTISSSIARMVNDELIGSSEEYIENIVDSQAIITEYLIQQAKDYSEGADEYLESSQYKENYQEALEIIKNISDNILITPENISKFNDLMKNAGNYSEATFKNALAELNINDTNTVDILVATVYDEYDTYEHYIEALNKRAENDKRIFKGIDIEEETGRQLSPALLQNALDIGDRLNSLVTNQTISDQQAKNFSDKYAEILNNLYNPELGLSTDEIAQISNILSQGDFFSLSGLYELAEKLKNTKLPVNLINSVLSLSDDIVINLNTEFQTYLTTLTARLSDFEKVISNAQKGMDFSTAQEFVNTLEIDFTDLQFKDGKWFYDRADNIKAAYIKQNESFEAELEEEKNRLINLLQSKDETTKPERDKILEQYLSDAQKDLSDEEKIAYAINQIEKLSNNTSEALDKYTDYLVNSTTITSGQITKAIADILNVDEILDRGKIIEQLQAIKARDFANIDDKLIPYVDSISKVLSTSFDSAVDLFITAIQTEGSSQMVAIDASSRTSFEALGAKIREIDGALYAYFDTIPASFSEAEQLLRQAGVAEGKTPKEIDEVIASMADAWFGDNIVDLLSTVVSNYKNIDQKTYNLLREKYGNTFQATQDSITGLYTIGLDQVKSWIYNITNQQDRNKLLAQVDKETREVSPQQIIRELIQNRQELSEDNIESLATLLNTDYNAIKQLFFSQNVDGSYSISLENLRALIASANQDISNIIFGDVVGAQLDNAITAFSNLAKNQQQGITSAEEMQKQYQNLVQRGYTGSINSIFEFDEGLHAYRYSTEGLLLQIDYIQQELQGLTEDEQAIADSLISETKRQFAEQIDVDGLLSALGTSQETLAKQTFENTIKDYNTVVAALGETDFLPDANQLISALAAGGAQGVSALTAIAKAQGKVVTSEQATAAYRNEVDRYINALDQLTAAPGEIIDETAAEILAMAGGAASELGDSGAYVVTKSADLYAAYKNLLLELGRNGEATLAELNKVAALAIGAKDGEQQAIDALSNAANMTYEQLGEIFTAEGLQLTEQIVEQFTKSGIIEHLGGNKMAITDFARFADAMGWQADSPEYVSAFKSYNDSMIELNRRTEQSILDEAKNAMSAKQGDWVNITQLSKELNDKLLLDNYQKQLMAFGAYIDDGILKIADNANILGIAQTIQAAAEASGGLISSELAELADTIAEALANYAQLISGGIKGNLNNSQANQLQAFADQYNVGKLDFHETAEGLKLSNDSAINLYNTIKSIDTIQGQIVFDDLHSSLESSNEGLANISATSATIARTQETISKNLAEIRTLESQGSTSGRADQLRAENKQLEEQLSLYREIAVAQSSDSKSFDFMNRDLPDALNGPINYWNSVGKAYTAMNEAASSGYMAIDDFYNIINEMSNLAAMSGSTLEFMGQEIDGSAETAASLINRGLSALSNIDGKGVKIDLSKLGADMVAGAEGMSSNFHEGVKAMAKSQIEMLDAAIQLLEVVVAMEELGDIDIDKDNTLDLGEIFNVQTDIEGDFTKGYTEWADKVLKAAETNEDLKKALNSISVNGRTLEEMIKVASSAVEDQAEAFKELNMSEEEYRTVIDAFYQAAINGDYDLDHIQQSVWEILERTLPDGTVIDVGDRTVTIAGGTTTVVDWSSETTQQVVEKLFHETDIEKQKAIYKQAITDFSEGRATTEQVELILTLAMHFKTVIDEETGKTTYEVDGRSFTNKTEAMAAAILANRGENIDQIETINDASGISAVVKKRVNGIKYEIHADASGKMSYVYNGQEYSTLDDVASQIANERFTKYSGAGKFEASSSQSLFTAADQTGASQSGADFALQKKLLADVKIELGLANPEATATTAVSELEQQITNAITAAFQNETVGQSITDAVTTGIQSGLEGVSVPIELEDVEVTDIKKSHYDSTLKLTEDIESGEANVTTMTVNATNFQAGGILQSLQGFNFVTTSLALSGIAGSLGNISKASFDNISNLSSLFSTIQNQVDSIWQTVQNFANKTFTVNMVTTSGPVTSGGSKGGKIGNGTGTSLTTSMDSGGVKSASNGTKTVVSSVKAPSIDTSEFNTALSNLSRMLHSTGSAIDSFNRVVGLVKSTIDSIKSTPVTALATAMGNISNKGSAADALSRVASAMRNIPTGTKALNIRFDYTVSKNGASATGSNSLWTATGSRAKGNVSRAKGNAALAAGRQRTLMGELGPELVVSNGSYYVVGENGAEFVDLENDAIVFNHRQTKRLLTNGAIGSRGRPFTNETNAISFAKGTFGPARPGGISTAADTSLTKEINEHTKQSTPANIAKIIKPTNRTITESIRSISVSPKRHELKLYSMAKGSKNAGPAMASASAALALLKQLRAMWQSMLNASSRDLGSQAGRHGGGGGGGGGGGSTDPVKLKSVLGDIERWYNLIRQIDKLEKDITYQENLQSKIASDRVINGKALYASYKTEIDYLDQEIARSQTLADLQRRWYDEKRKEYNDSFFGKIYTYDENGLRQMTEGGPGSGTGLDILETLNRKENGKPVMNAVEQLQYLTGLGLDIGELLYNEDGTQIATVSGSGANLKITSSEQGDNQEQLDADAAAEIMERFWEEIDSRGEELDGIYDSIQEQLNNVLEKEAQRNALLQKLVDNQLSVEQDIYNAIVDREQAVIDELQKERDALEKASTKFIDGLNKSLNKEREMYQRNQDALELTKMQRQLAILQRSGGPASQIRNLQQQITDKQREEYFDEQERQINAIQEASDLEIERLDAQLDLMNETLEYQKKYGLLWDEVYNIMGESKDAILDFIKTYSNEFKSNSTLQNSENLRDIGSRVDQWTEYRDDAKKGTDPITKNQTHGWDNYLNNIDKERYKNVMNEETIAAARKAYDEEYATSSDPNKASAAANKVLEDALRQYNERNKSATTNTNTNNKPQQEQSATSQKEEEEKPTEGKKAKINQSSTTYYTKKADGSFKEVGYLKNKKNEEIEVLEEDVGKYGNKTVSKIKWNGKEYYIRKERIKFKEGGLIDFTGPAWVDGSPQHPEGILDAESTRILREGFLSNASQNVAELLEKIATEFSNITNASSALINNQTEGSIVIEKAEVNMNVNSIANDYDARRAGEQALEEMLSIARKSGTRGMSRR